eukprot:137589-Prymnesium_polylepis.1
MVPPSGRTWLPNIRTVRGHTRYPKRFKDKPARNGRPKNAKMRVSQLGNSTSTPITLHDKPPCRNGPREKRTKPSANHGESR